jgi:thymidylate synthase
MTIFYRKAVVPKPHPEEQYIRLVKNIIYEGESNITRNGKTKSIFGANMRFSLRNGTIPLMTTKRLAWKTCLHELIWFLRGNTSNRWLQKRKVNIWNGNSSREFLDKHGFPYRNEGDLGPIYGHQWRFFNAPYISSHVNYKGQGIDQISRIITILKGRHPTENKKSRRMVVSAWNPCQLSDMVLPPCHVLFQFHVNNTNELSCSLYQRSGDVGLGIPFNIASYSFLTHLIAHHTGLKPGYFIHNIGDCHIYTEHEEALKKQITRQPYDFPTLSVVNTYDNINKYDISDFEIHDYKHYDKIKMDMKA